MTAVVGAGVNWCTDVVVRSTAPAAELNVSRTLSAAVLQVLSPWNELSERNMRHVLYVIQ